MTTANVSTSSSALTPYQMFRQQQSALIKLENPEEYTNQLATKHGMEIAKKYFDLWNMVRSTGENDRFYPSTVMIFSGMMNDKKKLQEMVKKIDIGQFYDVSTSDAIAKDTMFFPLFAHEENRFKVDGKNYCYSCDGEYGERFVGKLAGQKIQCGTHCPSTPSQYNDEVHACPNSPAKFFKSADPCKHTTALYLVDSSFSKIYKYSVRRSEHDQILKTMIQNTKREGMRFIPTEAKWFSLVSNDKIFHAKNQQTGKTEEVVMWEADARPTDKFISAGEADVIMQLKAMMQLYQQEYKNRRDKKAEQAKSQIDALESQTFDVTHSVDEDGTPSIDF